MTSAPQIYILLLALHPAPKNYDQKGRPEQTAKNHALPRRGDCRPYGTRLAFSAVMSDKMSIDKKDPTKDDSDDSGTSSPENDSAQAAPQESQPAKRKGGRKPVRLPRKPMAGDSRQ